VGSEHHKVYQAEGFRWICSPADAIQSAMELAHPARPVLANQRAMTLAAALPETVNSVLDLGTGGGALLRFARALPGRTVVTSVDSDPQMQALARQHFAIPREQVLHIADAFAYLDATPGVFDLIFCDLFQGRDTPRQFLSEAFFSALLSHLQTDGAVVCNLLPQSQQDLETAVSISRHYFGEVGLIQFADLGNIVLLMTRSSLPDKDVWQEHMEILVADDEAYEYRRFLRGLLRVPAL